MEYRTCGKCNLYSRALLKCKNGKCSPKTLKDTISTMHVMGYSYICPYSKWKKRAAETLIERRQVNG